MRPCQIVLPVWIRPSTEIGGTIAKSGIFFKNLVRNYQAECTEIIMEAFETCDVKWCSAWLLALGKGGLRVRLLILATDSKTAFDRTIRLIRIEFCIERLGNEALSVCYPFLDPLLPKRLRGQLTPKSCIFSKNVLVWK